MILKYWPQALFLSQSLPQAMFLLGAQKCMMHERHDTANHRKRHGVQEHNQATHRFMGGVGGGGWGDGGRPTN